MKQVVTALFFTTLLCLTAVAQSSPATPSTAEPAAIPVKIAPGSVLPVQLAKAVDAKKAKIDDPVVATVTQDMKTQKGYILVPKSAKIIGHVTEALARTKEQKESHLGIVFDQVVLKNEPVQLRMSIQAVIWMQSNSLSGGPVAGIVAAGGQPQSTSSISDQYNTARLPINGQTQGVIGIPNVKLAPLSTRTQGSVLSSEKTNVKLEEGTMLLLKVN